MALATTIAGQLGSTFRLAEAWRCYQADTMKCSELPHSVMRAVRSAYFDIKVVAPMSLAATRGAKRVCGGVDLTACKMQACRREYKEVSECRPGPRCNLASHAAAVIWSVDVLLWGLDCTIENSSSDKKPNMVSGMIAIDELARSCFERNDKYLLWRNTCMYRVTWLRKCRRFVPSPLPLPIYQYATQHANVAP